MQNYIFQDPLTFLRRMPDHKSEGVSQILFGEAYQVLEKSGSWVHIKCLHDDYNGWIQPNEDYQDYIKKGPNLVADALIRIKTVKGMLRIPFGSYVEENQLYPGNLGEINVLKTPLNLESATDLITKIFLGSPYVWGGRTVFGIDCSGLSQMYYRLLGIDIPRDSQPQSNIGHKIDSLKELNQGDLAFFTTDSEKISHVGIIMQEDKIIHASGKVRIDRLTNDGILREETQLITHKLHSIRRII
ncbi:MAG: C40 family peptidase [Saprospiraceae bacterium]|nr:C40 family peptidase [Candidatus Vicinibacter affinis]